MPIHDVGGHTLRPVQLVAVLVLAASCGALGATSGRPVAALGAGDVWLSTNDHQFYYASSSAPYRVSVQRFAVTFTEDFEGAPLSDHWAREADYCFTWSPDR